MILRPTASGHQQVNRYVGADRSPRPAMARNRVLSVVYLGLAGLSLGSLQPAVAHADSTPNKGAQVYCFMRTNGNDHAVSWEASYALIKRQKSGVFKTSPEHAAVMITEAVVNDPGTYPECGRYLGDLFRPGKLKGSLPENRPVGSSTQSTSSRSYGDQRYGY